MISEDDANVVKDLTKANSIKHPVKCEISKITKEHSLVKAGSKMFVKLSASYFWIMLLYSILLEQHTSS